MRDAVVRVRLSLSAVLASLAMLLLSASVAVGHPLHTTITDLGYRREQRALRATIRVFADDFGRAVLGLSASAAAPVARAVSDAAITVYVRGHFTVSGPDGRALPLSVCGVRRSGDLVWVCVDAAWAGEPAGLRLENRMLFELYRDQINIVQATLDGARQSLLFTAGDRSKALKANAER